MVVNLAERYTNLEGQEDDVRVNFIRDVDVKRSLAMVLS